MIINDDHYHPKGLIHFLNITINQLATENIDYGILIANPSDLGLHNMFIRKNEVIFYDFEYAGKDSYIKCLFDFKKATSLRKLKI